VKVEGGVEGWGRRMGCMRCLETKDEMKASDETKHEMP